MGHVIDPAKLTQSGEHCLARLCELPPLDLPPAQLITVIGTVVEGHVSRILARLVVLSDVNSHPFGETLIRKQGDALGATWRDRNEWLKSGFGLHYAGRAPYQAFDVLVQARNAVVHGDGQLTAKQTRDFRQLVRLRQDFQDKLHATIHARISFQSSSAGQAMRIARDFVVDFDALVLEQHPLARTL